MTENARSDCELRRTMDDMAAHGPAPICCGVCQFEGRSCSVMEPPRGVQTMVDMYQRDFGFDFWSFLPSELFERIRGTHLHT